jgi:hypothetical protein
MSVLLVSCLQEGGPGSRDTRLRQDVNVLEVEVLESLGRFEEVITVTRDGRRAATTAKDIRETITFSLFTPPGSWSAQSAVQKLLCDGPARATYQRR